MFSYEEMVAIVPEPHWLSCSAADQALAWQTAQSHAKADAQERTFYNLLGLQALQSLLVDLDLSHTADPSALPPPVWEWVNGTVINVGKIRLAMIPSQAIFSEECSIPQEWIDIPEWAAHYYLPVQVNPEAGWIRILGYATHAQVKQSGFDPLDRTYTVPIAHLSKDLTGLWVKPTLHVSQPLTVPVPIVEPIAFLPDVAADRLISRLSQNLLCSPRLDIPFSQWAAIIASPERRQQLVQQQPAQQPSEQHLPSRPKVNLTQWINNLFETGWEAIRSLTNPTPAFALARGAQAILGGKTYIRLGVHTVELLVHREFEPSASPANVRILIEANITSDLSLPSALEITLSFNDEANDGKTTIITRGMTPNNSQRTVQFPRLKCVPGDEFRVSVILGELSYTTDFEV